jgi:hypothetical protein
MFLRVVGVLKSTLLKSYMRGANLRRWLKRPDCPEVIRQFKCLFDKAFCSEQLSKQTMLLGRRDVAHYTHNGVIFSHCSTHLGNSLVLYYPLPLSSILVAGSIQAINTSGDQVYFSIKRQAPLPPGIYDPFCHYPSFPARVYSSSMDDGPADLVPVKSVVSHVAHFAFSANRSVIVNLSRVYIPVFSRLNVADCCSRLKTLF